MGPSTLELHLDNIHSELTRLAYLTADRGLAQSSLDAPDFDEVLSGLYAAAAEVSVAINILRDYNHGD